MKKEIIIDKNQNLNLSFNENIDTTTEITIKENIKCSLDIFIDSKNKQEFIIKLEKKAQLYHNCITINTKDTNCKISQDKNSTYENLCVNYANNKNFITTNIIDLNKENAYCSVKIINIANNASQIESTGSINIKEESIQSIGHQKFEGIILDDDSSIQAQPNLEVENNDITCSHGASITQIDDEKLFYLKAKGFNKEQSINLIIHGYFDSVLSKMNQEFSSKIKQELEHKNII